MLDTEDYLELATGTETEAFDDDPFKKVSDIECSVLEYLLYARLTSLPCMSLSLKCEGDLPWCGSCKDPNLRLCRIGDTQDKEGRGESKIDTGFSQTETSRITETPSPTLTGRNPEIRVDGVVVEKAEEYSAGDLATPSISSQDSNLPGNIDQYSRYSQHSIILQLSRSLDSLPGDSPGYGAPRLEQSTSQVRTWL